MTNKVTLYVDNIAYQVSDDINLLQACLNLNMDLPYFCWHPAMGSVGACRQCAVMQYQNEEDTRGRLVMSCMTPVTDGMRISLKNEKAHTFRATNIEAIMTNHPHDCPVCEEGGDCHLQDMTLLSCHIKRRYPGTKRTHNNQYLGPFLNHEMNRCIGCYRCVRFYRDYCGGDDLNVFASKNNIYFGRAEPGTLENEFSGNLAEVCPTGVFTDKPFSQHYIRKWDLQTSPSICTHCSIGCNTYAAERGGKLRKINNRHHPDINGHFLCDRGRFGYEHANIDNKTTHVWLRGDQEHQTNILSYNQTHMKLAQWINEPNAHVIGIGSVRASIENNAALHKLVGAKNFYAGIKQVELSQLQFLAKAYKSSQISLSSLKEIEHSDAVFLIGEDVTQTAPRLALSIRQMTKNEGLKKAAELGIKPWQDEAVRNIRQEDKSPLIIINTHNTRLSDVAKYNINLSPDKQLSLLLEIEQYLKNPHNDYSDATLKITQALLKADRPTIITGTYNFDVTLLSTCLRVSVLLKQHKTHSGFYCATSSINALGLSLFCQPEQDLDNLIFQTEEKPPSSLIIMETDLYRYYSNEKITSWLNKIKNIIVIDHIITDTVKMADLVLPASSLFEQDATWLNAEARMQHSYAVMPMEKMRQTSWQWLCQHNLLEDNQAIVKYIQDIAPQLTPMSQFLQNDKTHFSVARQAMRSSARTAFYANIDVKEYAPKKDNKSQLNFSMEGLPAFRQSTLNNSQHKINTPITGVWSPKWNSHQAINKAGYNSCKIDINLGIKIFDDLKPKHSKLPKLQDPSHSSSLAHTIVCPQHHIYTNDELAGYANSIQQLVPKLAISLNQNMSNKLSVKSGESININSDDYCLSLPCTINDTIADDIILVPINEFIKLGSNIQVSSITDGEHNE
ncbi:NADH-quinone oxidoreductase subunit NuoG [Pseudoalteromonas denitrificans]|uniref:NADH-quinone oxidoreductase n=1 Tax=Pseudoalteromonas denitrificans DSM 6059 TaxID=1123010 RepID=A0A1I1P3H3_9GAMM|nr:NADH-quinone oxidoreductase subunit NuoG [Pseudoalteromonas denitrificans]SFD04216.1 NADH dehydrogenase subunit G [Pseudoalteromonas denitrificans DSM 6059]